jgi:hypothetical protein
MPTATDAVNAVLTTRTALHPGGHAAVLTSQEQSS